MYTTACMHLKSPVNKLIRYPSCMSTNLEFFSCNTYPLPTHINDRNGTGNFIKSFRHYTYVCTWYNDHMLPEYMSPDYMSPD
jgi:hypothetical protein